MLFICIYDTFKLLIYTYILKSCGVLNYAVQRISEAGHHKEIASVTSASTYFSVFNGVLSDALQRVKNSFINGIWWKCLPK